MVYVANVMYLDTSVHEDFYLGLEFIQIRGWYLKKQNLKEFNLQVPALPSLLCFSFASKAPPWRGGCNALCEVGLTWNVFFSLIRIKWQFQQKRLSFLLKFSCSTNNIKKSLSFNYEYVIMGNQRLFLISFMFPVPNTLFTCSTAVYSIWFLSMSQLQSHLPSFK